VNGIVMVNGNEKCAAFMSTGFSMLFSLRTQAKARTQKQVSQVVLLALLAIAVPATASDIDTAIDRGVKYLLDTQNPDGSWGDGGNTKDLNVFLPVPAGHHAMRAAVTALAVDSLREIETDKARKARASGAEWLLHNLPDVKRVAPNCLYNIWTHGYALGTLVRLHKDAKDRRKKNRFAKAIRLQISELERYQSVHGGWGYYDFRYQAKQPASSSVSFMNATVLIALKDAAEAGFSVPKKMTELALEQTHKQRQPGGTFLYSGQFSWRPLHEIHRPPGSLGRSQVCHLALRRWNVGDIPNGELIVWLDRLFERNGWLSIGRKRPVPHEAWFQVAGYFYYYGHYYAAGCIAELPAEKQAPFKTKLADTIISHQDGDGSWWDFPFFNYHQTWGTAFAVMTLQQCR
jgi:hypothetical protein